MSDLKVPIEKSDEQSRGALTTAQYEVLRRKGTGLDPEAAK